MANIDQSSDHRAKQMSLPFSKSPCVEYRAGHFRRAEAVLEAVHVTLKDCFLSREQIADEMSRLLGEKITTSHISNWAAESKNGWRIPLEWAAAFSAVTNDTRVIKSAFAGSGITILDDSEMVFYDIGKSIEEKREMDARLKGNRDRLAKLRIQGKV